MTRCVPSHENSVQGRHTLSSFYSNSGIEDRDAYSVGYTSMDGIKYCDGDCSDSGDEVIRRALGGRGSHQYNRRYLLSAENHKINMFEAVGACGRLDCLVG
ncbi:hypothetical protein K437DRAFT_271166 [Tilletiaria anomala UBC 951]|uniref:Uncharacterized protein n=1 Tax=Tilletiaria anomala (strain ATCC 24038 / CBS 436.72 / UBC 951) TaxID=1037660 RepID=A0A066V3K3_TILAU|nr:uncharacterized protein K437DRAFT_271166 [Tilletiaria anomala UBC 951]KDN36292.1 hypothetical protein K437DRAFT_271166 [Tilletiaria anomala UBC 951]